MAPQPTLLDRGAGESRVPFHTLRFNLRTFLTPANNATRPLDPAVIEKSQLHTIHPKSFNHLGVWAYLAIAFIIFATATVVSYVIYTCYHSSKKKMEANVSLPPISIGRDRVTWSDLETSDTLVKVDNASGIGEKNKQYGTRDSKIGIEMARNRGGRHRKTDSDSANIFAYPSNSQSSMSNANDASFELDNHYLASPPLAHTTDKAATYIPFHLPPPPPSPTPAHKEHLERQYRGLAQQSPVSPSPSFSLTSPLPQITPRDTQISAEGRSKHSWSGNTTTGINHSISRLSDHGFEERDRNVHFDSNNIRFAPPLNLFMTPSNAQLWNDPKLSPVQGSIIHSVDTSGCSSVEESSFSQAVMAASRSPPCRVESLKRSKSVLVHDTRRRGEGKENVEAPSTLDMTYGRNVA